MIDLGKKNILGVNVNAIDYEAATNKIIIYAKGKQSLAVTALAVHGLMTGVLDPHQRYRLNHFDLITPDGQPVRWAFNLLYSMKLPDRVYGPNLMLKVCEQAARECLPIYLYGSKRDVIESLKNNLLAHYPKLIVAGFEPSRFRQTTEEEKLQIIEKIRGSRAAITFVGLGCPRQEVWVYEYRKFLPMPLIAVGAAFDFHAGILEQAPEFFQKNSLEWFFRFYKEPKRLWKRYILLNPLYLWYLFLQKTRLKSFEEDSSPPEKDLRYG